MDGLILLARARAAGLQVEADGDQLRVRGPRRHDSLVREVLASKSEVLAALDRRRPPAARPDTVPVPGWFIRGEPYRRGGGDVVVRGPGRSCWACGSTRWWRRPGARSWICPTCHPPGVEPFEWSDAEDVR